MEFVGTLSHMTKLIELKHVLNFDFRIASFPSIVNLIQFSYRCGRRVAVSGLSQ